MRYGDYDHMSSGWGLVMIFAMVGIWALVAVAIAALIRRPGSPGAPPAAPRPGSSAEQILAERLARGDIDPEEYRTRMDALGVHRGP
jgi:putative membrane protein